MKQLFYVTFRHCEYYAFELEAESEDDAVYRMQKRIYDLAMTGEEHFRGEDTENWKAVPKGGAL